MCDSGEPTVYILVGREDERTNIAKNLLCEAGVKFRFVLGDITDGPLPQLVSGLNSFVGLGQISCLATRARHNNGSG